MVSNFSINYVYLRIFTYILLFISIIYVYLRITMFKIK